MTRWLMLIALLPAAQGQAGPGVRPLLSSTQPPPAQGRAFNFRIFQEPGIGTAPMRHNGIGAETLVSPNASLGIGLFNLSPRRTAANELHSDVRPARPRKAAIKFTLRF